GRTVEDARDAPLHASGTHAAGTLRGRAGGVARLPGLLPAPTREGPEPAQVLGGADRVLSPVDVDDAVVGVRVLRQLGPVQVEALVPEAPVRRAIDLLLRRDLVGEVEIGGLADLVLAVASG